MFSLFSRPLLSRCPTFLQQHPPPLISLLSSMRLWKHTRKRQKHLVQQFDQRGSGDSRLRDWLNPTVNILYTFSAVIGSGVALIYSPANVIFAGIGVLLLVAKDVDASHETLIDIFKRMEHFFKRLESYMAVSSTTGMTQVIVEILVEVLGILAIATKEVKERLPKRYLKRLVGKNDIDDAMKRLDKLTQEEVWMATAEVLKMTRVVGNNVKVLIEDGKETTKIVQQTASNIDDVKRSQWQEKLRTWLSPADPSINHNITLSAQHQGTTTWFFEGTMFKEWKSTPSLLWIHGKPGSGKSVLCSAIIQDIMTLHEKGTASLAYFYCDFRDEDKQSRRNLLLSILFQLSAQYDICCNILCHLYLVHDSGARKPSNDELARCLKTMLSIVQGPIYLIVDALDECPNHSGMPTLREEVLDLIEDLVDLHLPNLHICVTSRPEIDIQTTLEPLASLRISLHNQTGQAKDIADYVSSVVYSDRKMRRWRDDDKKLVIETLSERADGMFRWVYCQLEMLRHCLPPSVRVILDQLPESLDETYERVLRDINKANREHALRLLHCLTVATRPLRVEELAEILTVDFDAASQEGIPKLNPHWRWEDQHQAVLSTCSSLIAIVDDGGSQVVQFSHFSVKEFLTSDRLARSSDGVSRYHIRLEPAHTILVQACLGILLRLEGVNENTPKEIPLAAYAAQYWVDHARFEGVSPHIQAAMKDLFDTDKPHFALWLRVHDIDKNWDLFSFETDVPRAEPLYYAALCGFYDLIKDLTAKYPEHVNARGGRRLTPLAAALHQRHFQVAEFLLQHGADVHVRGSFERTLLHAVSVDGPVDVGRWLLNHGADVNAHQDDPWTPLHLAIYNGQLGMVRTLLEHGADVNAKSSEGETPLHLAAAPFNHSDLIDIMQALLDHGADVNSRDNEGSTPLHHSSRRTIPGDEVTKGTVEGSRLLLKHGARIEAENDKGEIPLKVASDAERQDMVEFLSGWGGE